VKIEKLRISDQAVTLSEKIPVASWDLDSPDVRFVGDIAVTCSFVLAGSEILVNGQVVLWRQIICSRCMEESKQEVREDFLFNYALDEIKGDYLEIDADVREQILLGFPMKVLCRPDCKGMCPDCGANLNQQVCDCGIKLKAPEKKKKFNLKVSGFTGPGRDKLTKSPDRSGCGRTTKSRRENGSSKKATF